MSFKPQKIQPGRPKGAFKGKVVYRTLKSPNKPASIQKSQVARVKNKEGNELRGSKTEFGKPVMLESKKGRDTNNSKKVANQPANSWTKANYFAKQKNRTWSMSSDGAAKF